MSFITMKRLPIDQETLKNLCQKYRIRRLALFGSVLKGTENLDSDIDLIVEFYQDTQPTLFDLVMMEEAFSKLMKRPVDLRTPAELSRYFRKQVLEEAEVQYESA